MGEIYKRIEILCHKQNINITTMCKETGISRGTLTDYKMGRTKALSQETLIKIVNYFRVSLDYLMKGYESNQKEAPALTLKDERDISKKLQQTLDELESSQDGLMFDGQPLDDETKELLAMSLKNSLELSKKIAKQKYTPKKYRKPDKSEGD